MTIKRNQEWGERVKRPVDLVVAKSDADLAALVSTGTTAVAVSDGDVARSLGRPVQREHVQRLPMDLLRVHVDDGSHVAVAHVVARRSWWHGTVIAVMNVDQLGAWNVAPRAHPNDGRFDVVEATSALTVRQRLQARSRLVQGTHLPHPSIENRTAAESDWRFDRPTRLWIDGVERGSTTRLRVEISADAYALHV